MNQGFCSGVFLCFLYFSSLFPLRSLSFLLLSAVIILVSFPSPYRLLFIPNPSTPFSYSDLHFYGSTCNFPVMSFASIPFLSFFRLLFQYHLFHFLTHALSNTQFLFNILSFGGLKPLIHFPISFLHRHLMCSC